MSLIGTIKPAKGSTSNRKRIGRGNASGQGRTAGKGHNGYKSRSGASGKLHYEGGQMPLMRRLPKRGFTNHLFKNKFQIVNLSSLENLKVKKIDNGACRQSSSIHSIPSISHTFPISCESQNIVVVPFNKAASA